MSDPSFLFRLTGELSRPSGPDGKSNQCFAQKHKMSYACPEDEKKEPDLPLIDREYFYDLLMEQQEQM